MKRREVVARLRRPVTIDEQLAVMRVLQPRRGELTWSFSRDDKWIVIETRRLW